MALRRAHADSCCDRYYSDADRLQGRRRILGMIDDLQRQDPELTTALNRRLRFTTHGGPSSSSPLPICRSIASPLRQQIVGTQGSIAARFQFVKLAALFGVTLGMLGLGGLLARVYFGDALYAEGVTRTNHYPSFSLRSFRPGSLHSLVWACSLP